MSYRIVVDSCGEFTEEMAKDSHFVHAALNLEIDGNHLWMMRRLTGFAFWIWWRKCPNCPKSSCPSPEVYRSAFDCGADHLYAVNSSAELSGSYNSAVLGQNLYLEDHPDAKIHVFNSCSASVGETLLAKKIQECEEAGMEFEEVIKAVEAYQAERQTLFCT